VVVKISVRFLRSILIGVDTTPICSSMSVRKCFGVSLHVHFVKRLRRPLASSPGRPR
jgi:hypothetical protein